MVISKFADTFIEPVVVGVFTAIISVVSSDNDIIVLRGERDVNPLVVRSC